jgi:hypothetical protein
MHRVLLFSLISLIFAPYPTRAWLNSYGTFGELRCAAGFSDKYCLLRDVKWIASGDSSIQVQVFERKQYSKKTLKKIFAHQGVDWAEFEKQTTTYGVTRRKDWNDEDQRMERYALRGIITADGKTELLPAEFKSIFPLSDQIAVVKTVDNKYKLATMERDYVLSDIPVSWSTLNYRYGNSASKPMVTVFEGRSKGKTTPYYLMDRDGSVRMTVDNALAPKEVDASKRIQPMLNHFPFRNGLIGFPILTDSGVEASVFVNAQTGIIDRIDEPLTFIRVPNGADRIRDCGRSMTEEDPSGPRIYWQAMVRVGELPEATNFNNRGIFLPLDDDGRVIKQKTDMPFVGMSLVRREWVFVYLDKGVFSYKVVGEADRDLIRSSRSSKLLTNLVPMANRLDMIADVWAGDLDYTTMNDAIGEVVATSPGNYFAVRLFLSPEEGVAGGLTDWIGVPLCDGPSVNKQFKNVSSLTSGRATSDNPRVAASLEAAAFQRTKLAKARYNEALKTAAEARERNKYLAYVAEAKEIMRLGRNVRNNGTFLLAARNEGGDMLAYYMSHNSRLPFLEDASEICRRFGSASRECGIVWPWAQGLYDEERAARDAEAKRYAERAIAQRAQYQREISTPLYKPSGPREIRYCWRESGFWNC